MSVSVSPTNMYRRTSHNPTYTFTTTLLYIFYTTLVLYNTYNKDNGCTHIQISKTILPDLHIYRNTYTHLLGSLGSKTT